MFSALIERWKGAAYALAGVVACEVVARFATPFPDGQLLHSAVQAANDGGLLRLYDFLTVGAMSRGSIFALGIMPYLSASVYVRVVSTATKAGAKLWTHDAGRQRLTRITRGLTVGLAVVQSYGYARFTQSIPGVVAQPGVAYLMQTTVLLTAASVFAMWLCEHVIAEDEVPAPKGKRSVLPEISGGYDAIYAQLRAARQKQAL